MYNLDQILGDKQFWRFEVRNRHVGDNVPAHRYDLVPTLPYGRHELYLAVNDFLTEIDTGNADVEMYVVMSDDDPALADAGHWERLVAFHNPERDGGWQTTVTEVETMAVDIEKLLLADM